MKFNNYFGGLITAATILLSAQSLADNPMKSVFDGMVSNSTSAGAYSTRQSNGWTGGGYSYRVPNMTPPPIVTFTPPKANVGCNGADFFLGSFSVINKDEIVQIMRGVANGSAAFAFSVAMEAVCPTCIKEMERLQSMLEKLNADSRSSCQATMNYLANSQLGSQAHTIATDNALIKPGMIDLGFLSDVGQTSSMQQEKAQETLGSTAAGKAYIKDKVSANLAWSAFKKIGVDNWHISDDASYSWPELLMSLFGTVVLRYDDTGKSLVTDPINSTITLRKLVDGASDGETIKILKCDDSTDCLNPTATSETNWQGLREVVYSKVLTLHGYMRAKNSAQVNTASMQAFQNMFSSQSLILLERADENQVAMIAETMVNNFAYNVVGEIVKDLLSRMSNLGVGTKDTISKWMPDLKKRRDEISADSDILSDKGRKLVEQEANNLTREKILLTTIRMK